MLIQSLTSVLIFIKGNIMNDEKNINTESSNTDTPAPTIKYQGIFIRFLANMIDTIIFGVPFSIVYFFSHAHKSLWFIGWPQEHACFVDKVIIFYGLGCYITQIYLVLFFIYRVLFEWLFGATLGKMATGIIVVKTNGQSLDFKASLIRNLMRIIDALPFSYMIGIISIMCSEKQQRLGDKIADTIVIAKESIQKI
jgi:uncharacterized RDD family membrane protein YckC